MCSVMVIQIFPFPMESIYVASFKPVSMVYRGDGYSLVQATLPTTQ